MTKSFSICILLCVLMFVEGLSQSAISNYSYHSPSTDKESWQRLNLWLSASYIKSVTYGMAWDTSLIYVSRFLGLSRISIIAEGIDDPDLFSKSTWFDKGNIRKGVNLLSTSKGKQHIELLILLGGYYAFQPGSYRRFRDSVEYFLKNAIDESRAINAKTLERTALCLLGKVYIQGGDPNGARIFNTVVEECDIDGDKKTKAKAYAYRGLFTSYSDSLRISFTVSEYVQQKINYLDTAIEIYKKLNDIEGQIALLSNEGVYYLFLSRQKESHNAFAKALELENSIGYPYSHYTTDNMAAITGIEGNFGEPLKYALQSVQTAEKTRDSIGWANFYNRLGGLYYVEGDRDIESLKWLLKALNRHIVMKDATAYRDMYNIVQIMNETGQKDEALALAINSSKKIPAIDSNDLFYQDLVFASAYRGVKQYKQAENFLISADSILNLAKVKSENFINEKKDINLSFGTLYFTMGEFAKSKKYLELILSDTLREKDLENEIQVYKLLISIDSVFHDDPSAAQHYRTYTALLDSNFRVSKIRQAEELQVIYKTQEKENQIALQKAKLERTTFFRNVFIDGAILLIILLGLIYNRYRQKQKTNRLLQAQQVTINRSNTELQLLNNEQQKLLKEKEWLIKEIHHRVKNNLQMVISLLNAQSEFLNNPGALDAIKESRERMQAIAIIHQKLYQADNTTEVNMRSYVHELVDNIKHSFANNERILFKIDVDDISLDISQSVPLGLILNEAITNAIKYAYPKNETGLIQVSLKHYNLDKLQLKISDQGKGIPANINADKSNSLGLQLIKLFSEQLDGELYFVSNNGFQIILNFKTADYKNVSAIKALA